MNFHVLTLFPEMIENGMNTSITGRAITKGLLTLEAVNIRDYAFNKHQKVDDYTYGGGAGMLMQAEPVYLAYEAIANRTAKKPRVVYLTPQGQVFNQAMAREMAQEEDNLGIYPEFKESYDVPKGSTLTLTAVGTDENGLQYRVVLSQDSINEQGQMQDSIVEQEEQTITILTPQGKRLWSGASYELY